MILALFAAALVAPPAVARPRRIVSMNLCADQYVMALADPGQIASLSRYARDPGLSFAYARARTLPVGARSAEQVLLLKPDLLIGVPFAQKQALAPLAARGVPILALAPSDSFAAIGQAVTEVAAAVGHPARGRALIAAMRARLARIGPPPGRGRVAAYYQRRGYLTGTGTLVDEMLRRVGLVNLATRLKLPPLSRLSVERMAIARPDYLILESRTARVTDQGSEMLHHPLLDRAVPPARRLYIDQALTVCGGPSFPIAVERLARRIRASDATPSIRP